VVSAAAGALALAGCSGQSGGSTPTDSAYRLPPTTGSFDYQLTGVSDHAGGDTTIDVVARDATVDPLPDAYNVCYVNGYQTQPDASEGWLRDHPDLVLHDESGSAVADPDWPDEYILDPSTPRQRAGILAEISPAIDQCAEAGFDAVEIDNLDAWTRFDAVDDDGARELAGEYADLVHERGMAIAQKNTAELTPTQRNEIGFDFAIVEECAAWDECGYYTAAYGDHVLQIEYPDTLREADLTFADACDRSDRAPLMILRDRELVSVDDEGYRYESCR